MNFFKILLILPFLVNSDFSLPFLNLNLSWNINLNINDYYNKLKSSTPEYIKRIQNSMSEYLNKTKEERTKYLNLMSNKVKETYEQIKTGIKKGSANVQSKMKYLIEITTETAKALSYKYYPIIKSEVSECYNNKKEIFNNLMQIVEENFGKCSVIVDEIYNLSENVEYNFKSILFLVISLTENPDIITKGSTQIIYDIINCLQEKFPNLWSSINSTISEKINSLIVKQDLINLLAKSISNLVTFLKFEESYDFIGKAENLTGFIKSENAQKVYKNIFNILKKFNEFGSQTYNISANLILNVFSNDKNTPITKTIDHKEKGIRIKLHLSYMLKDLNIHSVQAVVFDSPLVSFKLERKTKGWISNTFVGITLYDKEGNEIFVKNLKLDKIEILFKKKLFKAMKTCLYYNEEKNEMDNDGIDTQTEEFDGEEYIKCIPQHLSSFTIGNLEKIIKQKKEGKPIHKYGLFKIGIYIIFLVSFFYLFRAYKRKKYETIKNQCEYDE